MSDRVTPVGCFCGSSIIPCPMHNKDGPLPNPGYADAMRALGQEVGRTERAKATAKKKGSSNG